MAEDLTSHGSMTYTPSPPRFRVVLPDLSQVLDGHMSARRRERVHFAPFASLLGEDEVDIAKKPLQDISSSPKPSRKLSTAFKDEAAPVAERKNSSSANSQSQGELGENEEGIATTAKHPSGPATKLHKELDISASFSVDSFAFGNSKKRSSSVSEPFAFILGSDEKENNQRHRASIASIDDEAEYVPTHKAAAYTKPPLRKMNRAGNHNRVQKSISGVDWQSNVQEAKQIRELVEEKRRKGIQLSRQLNTQLTRQRVGDKIARRQEVLEKTNKEVEFKSIVHQAHKKTLKDEMDESRRKSIAVREKIRANRREGEQKLQMLRIEEDRALYEERYEASVAQKTYKSDLVKDRRESLALRSDQAAYSRKQIQEANQEEGNREHESFQLKFNAAKDVEHYLESEQEKRRKSLADRNAVARQQRQQQADEEAQQARKEHEMFELELEADRDAASYKDSVKLRDRTSLAHRGLEARRRRVKEEQLRALESEKEHESYELTWAGRRDADAHCKKLKRLQREDLALQNREHCRKARVMDELRQLEREKEAESYVLKRAGEKDAERYLEQLAKDRRKSLQLRGVQTVEGRKVEQLQRAEEIQKQHEDEELQAAAHKDMEDYRDACKARDRLSLQYREKEARRKHLQEKNEAEQKLEQEHHTFELKSEDRKNVADYVKECKQRRRMSLAYRAKESKRHARWVQQQKQRAIAQQRRQAHANLMDKHYQELARHEERLRLTQEAIRHSGCAAKHRMMN